MKKLTLEEWDQLVGRHLQEIDAGAEKCERHANQLLGMPDWEALAMDQLERAERIIGLALKRLQNAKRIMREAERVA